MSNIIINGLNSNSAGGKSVLTNFLYSLKHKPTNDNFIVLLTRREYEAELGDLPSNIKLVFVSSLFITPGLIFFTYFFLFRFLEVKFNADKVLSFGDLVPICKCKLIYYFDWAYAVYPEHEIWNHMSFKSKLTRKVKMFQIQRFLPRATATIAQTKVIKKRLEHLLSIKNVKVINNAVNRNIVGDYNDFHFPSGVKFLYLTRYYPHKNIDILLDVANLIKKKGVNFKIILTISAEQHINAKCFLNKVKEKALDNIIVNIGEVEHRHISALYDQVDYLLMPSTLESFSGSYVEALQSNTPILTSNLDFAHEVCGNAAFYFDEKKPTSIFETMVLSVSNINQLEEKIQEGARLFMKMDDWQDCSKKILDVICEE